MPSGRNFTPKEAAEMQRKSVISRKRNSASKASGEKQQPTRDRKTQAIALHDDGKGLDPRAIAAKLECSRRSVMRYLKK